MVLSHVNALMMQDPERHQTAAVVGIGRNRGADSMCSRVAASRTQVVASGVMWLETAQAAAGAGQPCHP